MSEPSDHSLELAAQLRATALKNLGLPSTSYRSAISGKFVSSSSAKRHPAATTTEQVGSGSSSKTSRSSRAGRSIGKSKKG